MLGRLPLKCAASLLVKPASRRTVISRSRVSCSCRALHSTPRRWSEQKPSSDAEKREERQGSGSAAGASHQERAQSGGSSRKDGTGRDTPQGSQGKRPGQRKRRSVVVVINVRKLARAWACLGLAMAFLILAYCYNHMDQVPYSMRIRFIDLDEEAEKKLANAMRENAYEQYKGKILPAEHPTAAQIRNIVSRILAANHLGRLREQPLVDAAPLDDWSGSTGNSTGDKDGQLWNPDLVEADPYASTSSSSPSSAPVMDGTPPGEWDVIVVNDKRFMNAYADIGLVVIGTGFLPICQNEQGLAAVLAHEIAHVVAHHRAENISKISLYYCVAAWGIAFFGPIGLLASMTPWVLGLFSDASLSEAQEMEADFVGINLMARACYDPRAASEVLLRLARIEEDVRKKLPREEHARTHPLAMERARVLESRLRQGYTVMSSNPDCADALAQFRQAASSLRA